MFPYWMVLLLMSGIFQVNCKPSSRHVAKKKDIPKAFYSKQKESNTGKGHFAFLKRNKVSVGLADEAPLKQGSFKIDDGKVIGGGIFDIGKDGVSIDLKLKIAPDFKEPKPSSSQAKPTPASTGAPGGGSEKPAAPGGGSKTTAGPTGSVTTTAPGGGSETTAAPTGSVTTTAPGGGSETTAAPGGGSETTASPGNGSETTVAPGGGSETTAAPGGSSETTAAPGNGSETTAAPSTGSDDEQEALSLHNKYRKIHDAPMMTLNAEMSQSAASYAQKIANQGSLNHASQEERDNNGENLSYGCSSSKGQTTEEAVNGWYNEVCDPGYSFGSESMGGAGHFTQLVWKESVELGFGKADVEQNGMKCTYYVARYKPAGNMIGDFAKNVVKGSFDPSSCSKK